MECENINCQNFGKNYKKNYIKHTKDYRNNYLKKDNMILFNRFTWNTKDYTIKSIKYTLSKLNKKKRKLNFKKEILFQYLIDEIYKEDIHKIINVQSIIRRYLSNNNIKRGLGYFLKDICKNNEDFYFMTTINEIENKYLFSYKDTHNNVWFFDIRSFKKLIEHKAENPYTREIIPNNIISNANYIIKILNKQKIDTNIEELLLTNKKDIIKQKCVDLASNISEHGYFCDIQWILSLNLSKLKKLYRSLEDIWNYRAYLTTEVRSRIAPPDGKVYNIRVRSVYDMNDSNDIIDLILTETNKFNNAIEVSDKTLGYMYFLIGLSEISQECWESNPLIRFALI